jgi:hypothetical protein
LKEDLKKRQVSSDYLVIMGNDIVKNVIIGRMEVFIYVVYEKEETLIDHP